jgi:hypothetical protein
MQKQPVTQRFERFTGPYSYIVTARRIDRLPQKYIYAATVTEMVQYPHAGATGIIVKNKPGGEHYGDTADQAADKMIADVEQWILDQTRGSHS